MGAGECWAAPHSLTTALSSLGHVCPFLSQQTEPFHGLSPISWAWVVMMSRRLTQLSLTIRSNMLLSKLQHGAQWTPT